MVFKKKCVPVSHLLFETEKSRQETTCRVHVHERKKAIFPFIKYEDEKTTPLGTGPKVWNAVTDGKMTDVMTGKVTFSYQKGELMDIRANKIKADLIGRGISEDRINVTRGGATGSPKGRTVTFSFQ